MASITVTSITPVMTHGGFGTAVKATGTTGGATDITVQALLGGISIGADAATVQGANWTCTIDGEFTPPGTLEVQASDDAGKVGSGSKSIDLPAGG